MCRKHPEVNFARFGAAGNAYRHTYGVIDYSRVWDDVLHGQDIAALEKLLSLEVPFYRSSSVHPEETP
jgi:uncharacterized protein with HEPN domain